MQLTNEQAQIVRSDTDFLCVKAFAGTGKTSTLVAFAKARPKARMLYLAFNKAIQLEAATKFPSNVTCKTSHGLAYGSFGHQYAAKLQTTLRPLEVLTALGIKSRDAKHLGFARAVTRLLLKWLASDKTTIADCVSTDGLSGDALLKRQRHIESAKRLWATMVDVRDTRLPMLHDGYLKLYQLSNPGLRYDCLLFDEAQDANPVTSSIVATQACRKVFVGDSHQQIYSFRGAVDALVRGDFTQTGYLTTSFRFGPDIAYFANALIRLKGEVKQIQGKGTGAAPATHAFIARGNAAVFEEAVAYAERGETMHFPGGISGYRLDSLQDMYWLKLGERARIRDAFIRSFQTLEDLEAYADSGDERDIKAWCRVLKKSWRQPVPALIDLIRRHAVEHASDASVTLTTAHKAKGLEFGFVTLAEDYPDFRWSKDAPDWVNADVEEVNLLYVAATRAQISLLPNKVLSAYSSHLEEYPKARLVMPKPTHSEPPVPPASSLRQKAPETQSVQGWRDIALRLMTDRELDAQLRAAGASSGPRSTASYQPWSPDEDARLQIEWKKGSSAAALAERHGRTEGAIRSRLRRLGLVS